MAQPFARLLDRLDAYGTDDPDFHEGQPEDRCPLGWCGAPVCDHPISVGGGSLRPLWRHRIAALAVMLSGGTDGL
jgi:hypothetical protein